MRIRKANLKDCNKCFKLCQIPEIEMRGEHPQKVYFENSLKRGIFLVAESKGRVIGFILGFKLNDITAYIEFLVVSEKNRNQGLAAALQKEFEKRLKKKKIEDYFFIIKSSNASAIKLAEFLNCVPQKAEYKVFSKLL